MSFAFSITASSIREVHNGLHLPGIIANGVPKTLAFTTSRNDAAFNGGCLKIQRSDTVGLSKKRPDLSVTEDARGAGASRNETLKIQRIRMKVVKFPTRRPIREHRDTQEEYPVSTTMFGVIIISAIGLFVARVFVGF